ncbi:MAG: DUF2309 domain-containing protein [Myxococcales bacterium]|nr:DUF2309 domain-containing protein [Myxococcales bacterium]
MSTTETTGATPGDADVLGASRATMDADALVDGAVARIAPTWPLDRFIAVNPFWGFVDRPMREVAATLASLSGARLLMPRSFYRDALRKGMFVDADLRAAVVRSSADVSVAQLLALLEREEPMTPPRAKVTDVADLQRDLERQMSWRDFVTNAVSQHCASYFDDGQAQLGPDRTGGLYASWRRHAQGDRAPTLLMGLDGYGAAAEALPDTARELLYVALGDLEVPESERERYLVALLLDVNGWAAWCAYRRWTARLGGADDDAIVDLLAVRLAWEWLLHRTGGPALSRRWKLAMGGWPSADAAARAARPDDWLFQDALELAWREDVCARLPSGLSTARPEGAAVQAVFCIDVRSEVLRRALEAQSQAVQTLGFAGFFGLPVDYRPVGSESARPQLPGLLAPRMRVTDAGLDDPAATRRQGRLSTARAWGAFKGGAVSTFSFVESLGPLYAASMLASTLGHRADARVDAAALSRKEEEGRKPRLAEPDDVEARCDLAAGILRAMSLTRGFARLVALIGHGSDTTNNPHAAGLDCGACCGQTGEVNARAAAALLNEPAVREGLAVRGILVPKTTRFVAGLHNTTTDEVTLFDLDELPSSHISDVSQLHGWLVAAGATCRAERARHLGLSRAEPAGLLAAVRRRARDWSEVRPEWGLANNAAFIVAPREHCRHLDLGGRSFLHEYRFEEDEGFAILELIMTAPMVVTHWINLQYYASTVDNPRYGSGNKVLHNVVGGHLGVFEGNGGDLRIGLPMQSLHDGERWVHTPLRLCVFIEAPREAIDGVLAKHAHVRSLVDNAWLHLVQIDAAERALYAYEGGRWTPTR